MHLPFPNLLAGLLLIAPVHAASTLPDAWQARAPREEIRPQFRYNPRGGPDRSGSLVITHDRREGLDGWFEKEFAVTGGTFYEFHALRKTRGVEVPRRSALVRVRWQDEAGRMVPADVPESQVRELGHIPSAEPEYPQDGPAGRHGWTPVSGVYRAPTKATAAVVELHLQWAPRGRIEWSQVRFEKTEPPPPRKVRLATVH